MAESVLQKEFGLGDLVDLDSFIEVCKSFVDLYRVGVKVFDGAGTKLVDIKSGNSDFCGYIWTRHMGGRQRCTATVSGIKIGAFKNPVDQQTHNCFTGARYVVSPVAYEGDVIGRVILGPFRPDDVGMLPTTITEFDPDFDFHKARELMDKIREAPESTVRKILDHFLRLIEVIIFTGHKQLLTSRLHIEAVQDTYREISQKNSQIEAAYKRLQELDRLKSNFLATVSHELRTPLTSVIGYSEMLIAGLAGDLNDEQREYLQTILEKGESLLSLISSLLDISKIEARGVQLTRGESVIADLVKTAVTTVVPQAGKKRVTVVHEVDPALPPQAILDGEKMRQCLVNLLVNAVKFTPAGGKITVMVRRTDKGPQQPRAAGPFLGDFMEITVADSGIGIPRDSLDRIFDRFYQVDNSSTREFGGAGLGLAIVKSYVEAHGGQVRVESEVGKGSSFFMTVPLEVPQQN